MNLEKVLFPITRPIPGIPIERCLLLPQMIFHHHVPYPYPYDDYLRPNLWFWGDDTINSFQEPGDHDCGVTSAPLEHIENGELIEAELGLIL